MIANSIEKRCAKCGTVYPATIEYFHRQSKSKDGLNSYCKLCNLKVCRLYRNSEEGKTVSKKYQQSEKGKQSQKKYAATTNGHQKRRNNSLKSKYNFTLDEYNQLFKLQNGVCAICLKKETAKNQYGVRLLSVDHDYKTGEVRGLLCDRCNRMIGFAKESKGTLQKAMNYLSGFNK